MSSITPLFSIGPRIAGQILGTPYQQYRPTAATNPIVSGNLLGTAPVWITADQDGRGRKANNYGQPIWYGMFDPATVATGDYLVGGLGTFFVGAINPPLPMQLIVCDRVLTVTEPADIAGAGVQSAYGGDQRTTETVSATAWPASVIQSSKAHVGNAGLPETGEMPWATVLLPAIPGVTIRNNTVLTDDLGQRRVVSSAELTALGWRLTTLLATT